MDILNKIHQTIDETKEEYKNFADPKWLDEVTTQDKKFQNFDFWLEKYEMPPHVSQKLNQSSRFQNLEHLAFQRMLLPLGRQIAKGAIQVMLHSISANIGATEKILLEFKEENLANLLNAVNGIILSFRFQKEFKYIEDTRNESILSAQFNMNSKKMRYFRRKAVEKLCDHFFIEQKLIQEQIIQKLISLGEASENLKEELETNKINYQQLIKIRFMIQDLMETQIKEKIMKIIRDQKAAATKQLQSAQIFQLKSFILDKINDSDQKELVQKLIESEQNHLMDMVFHLMNSQLDNIFNQFEQALTKILMIINKLDIGSEDINEIEQKVENLEQIVEDRDVTCNKILKEIERNYEYLCNKIEKYSISLIRMIEQMISHLEHIGE